MNHSPQNISLRPWSMRLNAFMCSHMSLTLCTPYIYVYRWKFTKAFRSKDYFFLLFVVRWCTTQKFNITCTCAFCSFECVCALNYEFFFFSWKPLHILIHLNEFLCNVHMCCIVIVICAWNKCTHWEKCKKNNSVH